MYVAKSGKKRSVTLEDEQLSDVLRSLSSYTEDRLFVYRGDDGEARSVTAADVNAVIAEVTGPAFSAKDFRTWGGSHRPGTA